MNVKIGLVAVSFIFVENKMLSVFSQVFTASHKLTVVSDCFLTADWRIEIMSSEGCPVSSGELLGPVTLHS